MGVFLLVHWGCIFGICQGPCVALLSFLLSFFLGFFWGGGCQAEGSVPFPFSLFHLSKHRKNFSLSKELETRSREVMERQNSKLKSGQ